MTGIYEVIWPITDKTMPTYRLTIEAQADLRDMLAAEHLAAVGPIEWARDEEHLTCRVPVEIEEAEHEDALPWESRAAYAGEMFDRLAA